MSAPLGRILGATCFLLCAVSLSKACEVTKAGYEALQTGMSVAQATEVLGCRGEELSSSEIAGYKTIMLQWKGNSLIGNMNAMFQNDALISKAQFGLE